jgi:exopolysaccharide biosynthesis protein
MNTNTVVIDRRAMRENLKRVEPEAAAHVIALKMHSFKFRLNGIAVLAFALLMASATRADMTVTPWNPVFKGIDHATGTNQPTTSYPNLNVMHVLRVDLQDPDIQIITSPKLTNNYLANSRESGGYTVSQFQQKYHLQVSINGGLFDPGTYYLPAGTPMDIHGLSIDRGVLVSPAANTSPACLVFRANNVPELIYTNWPARATTGMSNVVSGDYCVLVKGVNIGYQYRNDGDFIHQPNPRTAFGISADKRYLFLMTIDGRQPGYSDGAWDFETGAWLIKIGAYDGVNLDGGGSTTMVIADSTGNPVRLNSSSAVADSGKERTVGSHFGLYAKALPGFLNDISVVPDDKTATVTWTTLEPATSQVDYGPSTNFLYSSQLDTTQVTNHTVVLTDLTPGTTYYYSVKSLVDSSQYASPPLVFTTTNYVTTNLIFDLTNQWRYSFVNLDGVNWTAPSYNDSSWQGPGAGLLWADSQGAKDYIDPKNTEMPFDSTGGFPFPTYYFRTHFTMDKVEAGTSLTFDVLLDDGAIFYLNGVEIYRLRMPDSSTTVGYTTLANAFPCVDSAAPLYGNAACVDEFQISGDLMNNLKAGDNVLAVEAHNYNPRSPDITFGAALTAAVPISKSTSVQISATQGKINLSWTGSGFTLQQSAIVSGGWEDVPGPITSSPYEANVTGTAQFFRLRR